MFAGSDRGGERAAAIYTVIETAKLNSVDPQAWLEDVLRRPASRLADLLPWNWRAQAVAAAAAVARWLHWRGESPAGSGAEQTRHHGPPEEHIRCKPTRKSNHLRPFDLNHS